MTFLIGQLTWWLLAVGVCAAVAGWALHLIRNGPKLETLERERDRLRGEFLGFLTSEWKPLAPRSQAEERELETMRTRVTLANAHASALERALGELRERREEMIGRISELERALDSKSRDDRAPELEGEIARLKGELEARPDLEASNALAWRLRYFEARTKYLESGGRLREGADASALIAAQAERDAARREANELRARLGAEGRTAPLGDDAANALSWRGRYLEARVRYLEGQLAGRSGQGAAIDPETEKRREWRTRYVERRLRHLQNELRAVRVDAGALAAARQRIGELEAAGGAQPETDVTRLKWRERYLDARVRRLEARLAGDSAPLAPSEAEAILPMAPPAPTGEEVRPASTPAPRQGAPDDLTLIDRVGPKIEASLHALGIYHFDQVAEWSRANVAWVDQYLRLRGRIERERWVEQARELARGAPARHQLYLEREAV